MHKKIKEFCGAWGQFEVGMARNFWNLNQVRNNKGKEDL
jgi:hypothetical protein